MTVVVISAVILAAELLAPTQDGHRVGEGRAALPRPRRTTFVAPISAAAAEALASISACHVVLDPPPPWGEGCVVGLVATHDRLCAAPWGVWPGSGLPKN